MKLRTRHMPAKKHGKDKYDRKEDRNFFREWEKVIEQIDLGDDQISTCGDCGKELEFVRPGKRQCNNEKCPSNIDWNRLNDKEYLESVLNRTKDRD